MRPDGLNGRHKGLGKRAWDFISTLLCLQNGDLGDPAGHESWRKVDSMIGRTVSHYHILSELGSGGMGVVYLAQDLTLGRQVALKFLPPNLSSDPDSRRRFLHEAKAAAALEHTGICSVHDAGEADGKPFIVMELLEGQTLRERLLSGFMTTDEVLGIAIQVAEALAVAHVKGIVHRDIKPENIMLVQGGQVKVMDFGLARSARLSQMTHPGTTLGTASYMSPEQAQGAAVDQRTDIWSLGVVLYEMLSGTTPFPGDMVPAVLYAVVHCEPRTLQGYGPDLPPELLKIVDRAMKKEPDERYGSITEMVEGLKQYRESLRLDLAGSPPMRTLLRQLRRPRIAIPTTVILAILCVIGAWLIHRQSKIRWARETAIPQVRQLVASPEIGMAHLTKAYDLAAAAERYIPEDPDLVELLVKCSENLELTTDPSGVSVYMKSVTAPDEPWRFLGVSPLAQVRVPRGWFSWKLEKPGYEPVAAVEPTSLWDSKVGGLVPNFIHRALDLEGYLPQGMVRVERPVTGDAPLDFFIDRYEVTNKQYKEFVDRGGYRDPSIWTHQMSADGESLTWEQSMARFVDETGRPGPSTWLAGDYPAGQDDYPVSGVSWFEAAAYAQYVGKSLPTTWHWGVAAGKLGGWVGKMSNFGLESPAPVGSYPSITSFGAYDMPGNVREWCWNTTGQGKAIRGGAWNDAPYLAGNTSQASALDRSAKNGFRCSLYPDSTRIPKELFGALQIQTTDFYSQAPASDAVFQAYKNQFAYDKQELNAQVEWRKTEPGEWTQEKVTVDTVYGNEKLTMYLFLPQHTSPPYQTVIYFPGSGSALQESRTDMESYREYITYLSFIVANGRAVLYPVYKGTLERSTPEISAFHTGAATHQFTEYLIMVVKDFRTAVDYLETRPDIDSERLAYLGYSWGGRISPFILSVEDRMRAAVLVVGGLGAEGLPEAQGINYVTQVKVPVLMLNGRYDMNVGLEERADRCSIFLVRRPETRSRFCTKPTILCRATNSSKRPWLGWITISGP